MIDKKFQCPNCNNIFNITSDFIKISKTQCPKCHTKGILEYKKETFLIEARNLHKIYDGGRVKVHALQGVNLRIKQGEMLAIMGVSGCGKTTLLNCLSGLDTLTEGSIRIEGNELNLMSDQRKTEYRANKMGFIFQFYNLLPVLTAVENIELPLLVARVNPKTARQKALEALQIVGLKGWEKHKPSELSGGQRQRVTIARSLVNNPLIVFGDEPTGDLDRETSEEIMDLLCKLNKQNNQTFILVTHDSKIAEKADRILVMGDGVVIKQYRPMKT
jgi:putative ABC transport system ATP-binding protein